MVSFIVDNEDVTQKLLLTYEPDMSKKSKLAFWLVARCQTDSKRMEFTQELQNFIPIGKEKI